MSSKIRVKDVGQYLGQEITLKGWLYNKRSSGKLHFLQLRDGSGIIQCVMFKGEVSPELFELGDKVTQESSIIVTGTVREDKRSPLGFELGVKNLEVVQMAKDYPISPKEHGPEFLMHYRHLWLRSARQTAILRIRDEIIFAIREYFHKNGFVLSDSPILTPAACEGTSTLFETDYFGEKAFLSQSGQLYSEASAMALGRTYCFGPTFRAEKSGTVRHVAEFWHVEPEVCFVDLDGIIEIAQDFIKSIIRYTLEHCPDEMAFCDKFVEPGLLEKLNHVVSTDFARVTYTEAVEILQSCGKKFEFPVTWGCDLQSEHERYLTDEHFKCPVFVTDYPKEIKSFYMKQNPDGKTVAATDLLVPTVGEIIGCSERETDLEKLTQAMIARNMPLENYKDYLDTRKYGTVEHSGFGLGFDRMVMYITGIGNIRDVLQFPRAYKKIY